MASTPNSRLMDLIQALRGASSIGSSSQNLMWVFSTVGSLMYAPVPPGAFLRPQVELKDHEKLTPARTDPDSVCVIRSMQAWMATSGRLITST